MELRVLRYYLAVIQEQSISKAAERLNLTQPTLSRQLMDLEEELGVKLMVRGKKGHGVSLTEDGILLKSRALEIVELADRTEAEFLQQKRDVSGDVFIGAGETDVMRSLAKIMKQVKNIHFHLFSGNAGDITERLDKGLIDFGIMIGEANLSKYNFLPLNTSAAWGVLMRNDDPLASNENITPKDLMNLPLIISEQSMRNNELSGWFHGKMERLNITATYNLVHNATYLVEEGIGYALIIENLVNTNGRALCFRPLKPVLEGRMNIAWKKGKVFSKAAELFLHEVMNSPLSSR